MNIDKYRGLSKEQAEELLKKFGPNEIKDPHRFSFLTVLLRQIKNNFVIYLLFAAALISFFVGKDFTAYTILAVIFMVVVVGFIQEYRAEKAVSSLKKMLMPVSIVRRSGKDIEIPSSNIVVSDIVILGNGERVPADCVVLEEKDLRMDESVLTGESKDISKTASQNPDEPQEENLIFMGTYVVNGHCIAKVLHTGMNTRFGKIAAMVSTAEKELPLQKKINRISRYMVIVAITASLATGILLLSQAETVNTEALTGILILVIALSVSAFPEGFPVVLITALAIGASRMAKQNAIVNRMSVIETLGETTVICTDKTGTLTRAEMTVRKIRTEDKLISVTGSGFQGKGEFLLEGKSVSAKNKEELNMLFKCAALCNDANIERTGEDLEYRVRGSPTEGALLVMAAKGDVFSQDPESIRIEEIPFSSDRKMMSILSYEKDKYIAYAKGAPEVLIEKCSYFLRDGKVLKLTKKEKEGLLIENHQMNSNVLRTLALAYKMLEKEDKNYKEDEFIFLGLVGMEDPPREEVKETLKTCFEAGIRVKMITGDNRETALAIGREIELTGKVMDGKELDKLTDEELSAVVTETVIFTRVRPEHKLRIVRALKTIGEVVTMTGDGVNDAPSLKEAHIGVAMGKNGTDVSRSVADLTLKDDNFVTLVAAIKEGRTIFNNIRKFVTYQLSCNIAELSILFFGVLLSPLFGWVPPLLLALQILFMNLVTDNLPALTLSLNPSSKDVMREKPRIKAEILNRRLIKLVLFNGALMAVLTLYAYFVSFNVFGQGTEVARSTALLTLILLEIASAFNFRSFRHKVLNRSLFVNKYLVYASFVSLFATLIIFYTGANKVFSTVPLGMIGWIIGIVASLMIIAIYDLLKDYSAKKSSLLLSNIH